MIGIYKYTNLENGHSYIGQSIDLERRKYAHEWAANNPQARDYNSQFHQAIRKYGIKNFSYEVVAELTPEEYTKETLNSLEKFFINYYDTYAHGYNATEGGDTSFAVAQKGEKNGRAKLTAEDVRYIRECYAAHIPFREVEKEYADKISKRGLQKVWWFQTWPDICPEYHTEENKYWHSHQAKALPSDIAANNTRAFTEEQVKAMRKDFDEGMTPKKVWKKYAPDKAWTTIYNIITRKTYQDIK